MQNRKSNYQCVVCGNDMYVRPSSMKKSKGWGFTCSKECGKTNRSNHTKGIANHQYGIKGSDNASFTGEIKINNHGYRLIYNPEHSRANHAGYVFEHILVMEKYLGRCLKYYGFKNKDNEVCHHIDRDKLNNDISNLKLMTDSEHIKLHHLDGDYTRDDKGWIVKNGKL